MLRSRLAWLTLHGPYIHHAWELCKQNFSWPGIQIAELCRRHGIRTSQFSSWREQARQGAKAALNQPPGRKGQTKAQSEVARLQAERERLRAVIAEITAENLELRKNG
jgi:transposase-like protein